jgi:glycosyltransferase involved in cell wall biosynthesis
MEISKRLKMENPEVIFLAPKDVMHHELRHELGAICFGSLTGHSWEQIELPLYIKKNYPSSILLNLCNTAPYFISDQVVTVHDVSYLVNKKWFSFPFRAWYSFLVPSIARKALEVLTVSNFSKSEIIRLIKPIRPSKVHVVYNSAADIFKQDIIEEKDNYILSVASIDPRKNLGNLVEAFKRIQKKFPGLKLILAGSRHKAFPEEMTKLMENMDDLISFTGYISDEQLADLYKRARLFVYISLYEGFGIPPLEAISSGCQVLLSDIPCHKECYSSEVQYCDPMDILDISTKMDAMLKSTPSLSDLSQLKHFSKTYSWQRSADAIQLILAPHLK